MGKRLPSLGERRILDLIRRHYGPENTWDRAFISDKGDAVIFVSNQRGEGRLLMANLTNLAAWRDDGSITSDEELLRDWLLVGGD